MCTFTSNFSKKKKYCQVSALIADTVSMILEGMINDGGKLRRINMTFFLKIVINFIYAREKRKGCLASQNQLDC